MNEAFSLDNNVIYMNGVCSVSFNDLHALDCASIVSSCVPKKMETYIWHTILAYLRDDNCSYEDTLSQCRGRVNQLGRFNVTELNSIASETVEVRDAFHAIEGSVYQWADNSVDRLIEAGVKTEDQPKIDKVKLSNLLRALFWYEMVKTKKLKSFLFIIDADSLELLMNVNGHLTHPLQWTSRNHPVCV